MVPEYKHLQKQDTEETSDKPDSVETSRIRTLQETLIEWKRGSFICANTILKLCGSEQSVSKIKRQSLDTAHAYLNYCGPPFWTWWLFRRHVIAFWTAFVVGAIPCILFFSLKNDYQLGDHICTVYGYNQHYLGYNSQQNSFIQGLLTVDIVWGLLPF
jgi:hypothetical protein